MNTNIPKKGLGRGLSSLMGDTNINSTDNVTKSSEATISIAALKPSPSQPRRLFDKNSINELAESIKSKGLVQPILVRPSKTDENSYEIIAGERRWRAAQIAQLHEIPAVIKNLDDVEALEIAIIENIQRSDLSPIEEAAGYKKLMEQYNHTNFGNCSQNYGGKSKHAPTLSSPPFLAIFSIGQILGQFRYKKADQCQIEESQYPE